MPKKKAKKEVDPKYASIEPLPAVVDNCKVCGVPVETMSYKGTGACGEIHRKLLAGESHGEIKALAP